MRRSLPAVIGGALGVLVALAVVLPGYVGLDGDTPWVQLAAFTPLVLVVATGSVLVGRLAGLVVLGRRRRRPLDERFPRLFAFGFAAMVGAAVVVLVAAGIVGSRLLADDPPPPGRALTVLSLNVDHGEADVGALAAAIRDRRPDLVVLPEGGDTFRARLSSLVPGYRGWSAAPADDDGSSTTLLAGPAVGNLQVATLPGALFGSLEAVLPGGVRVIAVHTAAPVPGQVELWHSDLSTLVAPACARPGPAAVVVGDVNGTEDQSAFRAAAGACTDVLPSVGSGTVATWPTNLPRWFGLQIDHVLGAGGVGAQDAEVLDVPGTDHRALFARLSLP